MKIIYTLFLSGSPQDYEWLPQTDNHAKQVCEKYFNLPPTETPHSSDFYVELFPIDNYSYYTYLHRKSVNGLPREGAHIALTMRISGGYCNQPNTIYKLLENVYMQYIDGMIMQRNGDGEIYLIPSLMKCEDKRKQMENALGQELQLISESFLPFGNEVSKSRQPSSVKYFPADSDNEQLLSELRKTHKLKLIPSFDYHAEKTATNNKAIEQLQQQIVQKDKRIQQLEDQLKRIPQKSDNSNNEVLQNVNAKLDGIITQLKEITNTDNTGKKTQTTSVEKKVIINGVDTDKLIRYLPWVLFVAALLIIIVIGLRSTDSDQLKELQSKIEEMEITILNQDDLMKHKNDTIENLRSELNGLKTTQSDIEQIVDTPQKTTNQKPPNINVGSDSDKFFYAGETYPLSMIRYKGPCTYEITQNKDVLEITVQADGSSTLNCKKAGNGVIRALDKNGKEIASRPITIAEAQAK